MRGYLNRLKKSLTPNAVSVVEANIDDMSGEFFGYVMDKLMEFALDVTFTPIMMKKNRPAIQVSVICAPESEQTVAECLFRETTTLGVRIARMERIIQPRRFETLNTDYGPIKIKISGRHAAPEYEDCKKAAELHNVPLRDVYFAANAALRMNMRNIRT